MSDALISCVGCAATVRITVLSTTVVELPAMSARRYYYFMSIMTTVDFVVLFCLLSVIIKIGRPATTRHHLSDLVHSIAKVEF